ncbi:hypothetical protein BS47DRAFT_1342190 [Hydnum rufescens UP504]|uniref:Pentatricopeptide repeat protein n=1 Tax=Hydnum rufescens UP504 TaxID=1448309 RepID=A0A9P6B2U6_9AGAM|nr:hypothetical protein BS47DRAFT_1342190 [Hydnum rufescens UP504]
MSLGIQPNAVTYTTLIHVYGGRRDPVNAERVFKHAMDNGVLPNQEMALALMQAHANSSSWRGVIRIFDHLRLTRPRSLWLNIEVYNILLRAYVLIGAPFSTVLSLLRNLESSGVVPNEGTYLLVIQSACDARKMDIGQGLLAEMGTIKERRAALRSAESFALTMLMGAYLRVGDKESAQYMYEQMEERNILPNSVTFGIIVRAYGNEGTDEGIRLAEDFLASLVGPEAKEKGWMVDPRGTTRALEDVFTPIMVAHGHRLNYAQVEHHFNTLTQMASSPLNIASLNPLLHAYSRVGDIQGVQEVWDQIFEGALSITRARPIPDPKTQASDQSNEVQEIDDSAARNPSGAPSEEKPSDESETMLDTLSEQSRRSNILCIPLSTYINALSAAGRHTEIAQVWSKVRSHGFGFDAHNWNHLAVALVRAGEPERAFEVLEKVILPYKEYTANAMTARAPVPSNLFSFINMGDERMPLDPVHPESDTDPSERITQHAEDIGVGRANPVLRRGDAMIATERFASGRFSLERRDESGRVIVGEDDDLAAPLHLFHQQSPAWNMWRPHRLTLHILDTTLRRLSAGRMIRPATNADDAQIPPEADGVGVDQALEMFERINDNYPRAVDAVRQIRKKLRRDEERGVEYKGYRSG